MTNEQREKIAESIGFLWAVAYMNIALSDLAEAYAGELEDLLEKDKQQEEACTK